MSIQAQPVAILRNIDGLYFDAVFTEAHEAVLNVTDNPVETGVVVSDHAYMSPLKVTITAGVSDTPLGPGWIATGDSGENYFEWEGSGDQFESDSGRARRAFELLTELQIAAEPFDVQTGLKLYTNMLCLSIRTAQDKDTAGVFIFTAELREIIVVNTQTVEYTAPKKGKTANQATPKKNKGEQQGTEVTDKPKKASLLSKLKGVAGK